MNRGAIILCGGQSSRMGRDKALLPFGPHETMLQRVVRIVADAVPSDRIVCVAACDQKLPPLPAAVEIVFDPQPQQGPLAGLAAGLIHCSRHTPCAVTDPERDTARTHDSPPLIDAATARGACLLQSRAAFATGCDAPLLRPAFISRMFELLGDNDIAAPHDGQQWHPLAAVYRSSILPQIKALLAAGERSLVALLESSRTGRVSSGQLRDVDPDLASLIACNTPGDYQRALRLR